MQVRSLQGYLRSLIAPLSAGGVAPGVLRDIELTCAALDAFTDLEVGQLVPLLQMTEEYRLTGVLPDLNDPLRPLVRALSRPETTVEEFNAAADRIDLKKVAPDQLRSFGLRVDPGFTMTSRDTRDVLLDKVRQAFLERRDPATAQRQRLERLRPLIERVRGLEATAAGPDATLADLKQALKPLKLATLPQRDLLAVARELGTEPDPAADARTLAAAVEQLVLRHKAKVKKERAPRKEPDVDPALVQRFVQEVRAIEERAAAPETTVEELNRALDALDLTSVGKDTLLAIARELGTPPDKQTGAEATRAIRLVVLNRKAAEDIVRV